MYKLKKNFLCAGILEHFFSVIFGHTLNVILGFIPRIHAKHSSSLDNRGKPEYDGKREADISKAKPHEISNFCQTCNSEKSCRLVMFFKI